MHDRLRALPLIVLATLAVAGCNSNSKRIPKYFDGEPDQFHGEGSPADYRFTYRLRMEKDRVYNQEVAADLALAAWDDAGHQKFVLVRPNQPVYTLKTYQESGDDWTVEVKAASEIEREEDWDVVDEVAKDAIGEWRKRYADLCEKYRWGEDRILFDFTEPPRGRFGFYRRPEGTIELEPDGTLLAKSLHMALESRYRQPPPPEVAPPRIFEALTSALLVFDSSPFPTGKAERLERTTEGWTVKTSRVVSAILQPAKTVNPLLGFYFGGARDHTFEVSFRIESVESDRYRIVGERTEFGAEGALSQGYSLSRYRRVAIYDTDEERFLMDAIEVEASHTSGDKVTMAISLADRDYADSSGIGG